MTNIEDELKQLKIDCVKLQERNSTPEAEEQHKKNPLRKLASMYVYYRNMGCTKQQARQYAEWNYNNIVEKK